MGMVVGAFLPRHRPRGPGDDKDGPSVHELLRHERHPSEINYDRRGFDRRHPMGLAGVRCKGKFCDEERKAMNEEEMKAELERLRTENAQLKNKDKGGLSLKVSEKGAVSLYGMGRFPVTLYKEQWLRILASASDIEAFIRENDSRLKTKE
jgi:hypothetical protein